MGRDGSRNAVPKDHEEEEDVGDDEPDGEICSCFHISYFKPMRMPKFDE